LMLVTAGIVVSAVLLRQRLDAVLSDVDGLANQLEETRNNLSDTQQELDDTKQALEELETDTQAAILALAADSEAALLALETRMVYGFHAQQAMAETTKAIQSLTQDDLGQARREITALRASLVAAAGFASEEDAVLLSDLESRASQAEADLTINAFAAQQTLEVIWRDLDELTASLSAQAAP